VKELVAKKGRLRRAQKLIRLVRVPLYRHGLRLGVAATIEHARIPFGAPFRTLVDVGARHGQFALFASREFPDAAIYCLEPHPPSRTRLRSLPEFLPQIRVIPFAAADVSGEAQLFISRKTDSSSLLSIMDSYTSAFPGTGQMGVDSVETKPLDVIFAEIPVEGPVLLKIDVQGTELSVLQGAPKLLDRADVVLVECSFLEFYRGQGLIGDVVAHLNGRFFLEGVFGLVRDRRGRCLQADLVLRRTKLAA